MPQAAITLYRWNGSSKPIFDLRSENKPPECPVWQNIRAVLLSVCFKVCRLVPFLFSNCLIGSGFVVANFFLHTKRANVV